MRIAITATVAAALALLAVGMLGVASAEAPTATTTTPTTTTTATPPPASPPVPTVSVQGVANVPIAQGASAASATAAYRQGMAAAVSDGQSKAEFLAGKVGATLGGAQNVTEGGGSIQCTSEESKYAEYEGEQPDFGSPESTVLPDRPVSAPAAAVTRQKKVKRKRPKAKKAAAAACTLSAQVSLVYAIS
jgi:hypothetical protein